MTRRLSINWKLVEQRRIAAGLTRAELAERLGRNGTTTDYLWPSRAWHDEDHDDIRLEVLERLCEALDLHPDELFTAPTRAAQPRRMPAPPAASASDDAVLEAALTTLTDPVGHGGVADALGWPLDRLGAALAVLDERLADTGIRVDHDSRPLATIRGLRPRAALLSDAQRKSLHRLSDLDGGHDPRDARTLYEIAILGFGPTETSDTIDPAAAIKFQRQGYVRRRHNSERLTASYDLVYSLMLAGPDTYDDVTATSAASTATYPAYPTATYVERR
jgi:DNA-binding Xre family transcriptional regulator